jgi:hypothetical protein
MNPTPTPTSPGFDGSRGAMGDLAFEAFGTCWSSLPTGAQVGLVLGFIALIAAMIWYAAHHERRHTPPGTTPDRPTKPGLGRGRGPGS